MLGAIIALAVVAAIAVAALTYAVVNAQKSRAADHDLIRDLLVVHADERRLLVSAVVAGDSDGLVDLLRAENAPEIAARHADAVRSLAGNGTRSGGFERDTETGEAMMPVGLG